MGVSVIGFDLLGEKQIFSGANRAGGVLHEFDHFGQFHGEMRNNPYVAASPASAAKFILLQMRQFNAFRPMGVAALAFCFQRQRQ
ncbi:hypothetical protein ELZ19_09695 [Brucella abortus]|nr:hypothetical protein ELZ19_09695 [Brucella abortus]